MHRRHRSCCDVVDGAYELAGPAMEEGDIRRFRERDAA
jgi:hypothetical protein